MLPLIPYSTSPNNFLHTKFKRIQAMAAISATTDINAPAQKVFDVITDLQSYSKWLPDSTAFKGTTEISESPVKLGTTYVESNPGGVRSGKVIAFERPSKVVFHQPMKMNPASEGLVIDIKVEVILKEKGEGVSIVERNVYLGYPDPLLELKTAFDKGASEEGVRVMDLLKKHVESLP